MPSTTSQTRFGPGGRELVDTGCSVHDERALRSEPRQHLGDRGHQLRRVDADDLRAGARRVRQRPEHVEDRPRGELPPNRRRVAHRRVVRGREQEAEAELVDRARDQLGRELEIEAERLEDVGRAGGGRDRPVAVLRHARAGGRGDERSGGRDVERPGAVAAGSGRVDEVAPLRLDDEHVLPHRLGAARDLVGRLALQAKRDEEAADLRRRRLPAHDRAHHLARVLLRQVAPLQELGEGLSGSRRLQEVPNQVRAERRQNGLRVELDAVDGKLAVPHGHDLSVRGRRGHVQLVRDRRRRQRVVAAGLELDREPAEEPEPVVADGRRLAVDELARQADLSAERLDDRLVPEADAERRRARSEPAR